MTKPKQNVLADPSWVRGTKLWLVSDNKFIKKNQIPKEARKAGLKRVIILEWLARCPKCDQVSDLKGMRLAEALDCECGEFTFAEDTEGTEFEICSSHEEYVKNAGPVQYAHTYKGREKPLPATDKERVTKYGLPMIDKLKAVADNSPVEPQVAPETTVELEMFTVTDKRIETLKEEPSVEELPEIEEIPVLTTQDRIDLEKAELKEKVAPVANAVGRGLLYGLCWSVGAVVIAKDKLTR